MFEIKYFKEYVISATISPITFECLRELSVSCALNNYYSTIFIEIIILDETDDNHINKLYFIVDNCQITRVNVSKDQSRCFQGSVDLADFHIYCSVFHADHHGVICFS